MGYTTTNTPLVNYKIGDTIMFGHYPQTEIGYDNTPIEWRVIAKENSKVLVISKYALDGQPYNSVDDKNMTWDKCTLRKWLNETFISKAFSSAEQTKILTSFVPAAKNPISDNATMHISKPGNDTMDKLFLLSMDEARTYLPSLEELKCFPTFFAREVRGVCAPGIYNTTFGERTCQWWLRSPGYYNGDASYVNYNGHIDFGGSRVNDPDLGIRPAFWLILE